MAGEYDLIIQRNMGWAAWILLLLSACSGPQTRILSVESGTQFAVTGDSDSLYFDMQGILWQMPAGGGPAKALSDTLDDLRAGRINGRVVLTAD